MGELGEVVVLKNTGLLVGMGEEGLHVPSA
jgi:hypothetical protein